MANVKLKISLVDIHTKILSNRKVTLGNPILISKRNDREIDIQRE